MSDFKITDKNGIKLKTANKYVMEDLAVTLTDSDINNIVSENIKKDISILGVTGTLEGGITPSGKIEITNTEEINVTNYETAQVVDSNLSAENIKKDVSILGVTGTLDGGITPSGKIEITNTEEINVTNYETAQVVDSNLSAENIKKDISILGVTGTFEGGSGSSGEDRFKKFLDTTKSARYLFYLYTGTNVDDLISYSDTENVTNMYYMFSQCESLQTIPQLDTSNVTNMNGMFRYCLHLTTIPQLNTSNVTNMGYMFYQCSSLQSIPQLDTSSVTDMNNMFLYCSNLKTIPQLDTSKVTNMSQIFANCLKLTTIDLTHMNITQTSYSSDMCSSCHSLTKFIIRNMDKIPVLNSNAFNNCYHFSGTVDATYNPYGSKDGRIYVPDNMVARLKSAPNWNKYANIIVPLSTLVE